MLFDDYRDDATRRAMIDYVCRTRMVEARVALDELRLMNHIGLAYVHRDMLRAAGQGHQIDHDPSEYAALRR